MRLAKLLNNSGFFMFNNIQYPPRQVDFDKIFRIDICFLGDF